MNLVNFLNLPVELICHILADLDTLDLVHCTQVNKRLRKVIIHSSRLQYAIELAMHNMVSVLPSFCSPPLATRLKTLREREHAWKRLEWKGNLTLDLPKTGSVYEFAGGIYGNGKEDERMVAGSIAFFQLPTEPVWSKEAVRTWVHTMGDLSIIDFTMDPMQDLLVLVTLCPPNSKHALGVHLRTLSTNEPHPKAPVSTLFSVSKGLSQSVDISHSGVPVRVQIAGNLLALLCKEILQDFGAHVEIWNWRVPPRHICTMSRMTGIDDFCFLTRDSFLIVKPGEFEVCTFEDPAVTSSIPVSKAVYELPPLAEGFIYWCISMSGNPVPDYVPAGDTKESGPMTAARSTTPFYKPRVDDRIHACTVYLFNPDQVGVIHGFVLFFNVSIFLKAPRVSSSAPPVTVPWEGWGPANTRWFTERLSKDWEHALYGCRTVDTLVVCGSEDEEESEEHFLSPRKRRLRVRDFNPRAVKRCTRKGRKEKGWKCRTVEGRSMTCTNGAFAIDVISSLPYTEVVSEDTYDVTDVMMDDSRVLLMKRSETGELCDIKILMV